MNIYRKGSGQKIPLAAGGAWSMAPEPQKIFKKSCLLPAAKKELKRVPIFQGRNFSSYS
jgi:hypothetical protein